MDDEIIIEELENEDIGLEESIEDETIIGSESIVNIGTNDHNQLIHRDSLNQHPISAITGLEDIINNLESSYLKDFTAEDWEVSGQQYQLLIPQPEHMLHDPYIVKLEMLTDLDYKTISMYGSKLLPNGTIRLLSDLSFPGRLILKGGL